MALILSEQLTGSYSFPTRLLPRQNAGDGSYGQKRRFGEREILNVALNSSLELRGFAHTLLLLLSNDLR